MKNKLPIGVLVVVVIILGVSNILLLKNNQKVETSTPTTQVPSPTIFVEVPMLTDPALASGEGKPMVGSDKDTHGCIGSAGYTWCEVKEKCLRVWEEKCEEKKETDSELIKQALYLKNKWPTTLEINLDVSKNDGIYASGTVSEKEGGGGYFYAKNVDSEWKIVADGNGIIMCEAIKDYPDYPKTMIPSCYDSVKGENINR